MTDIEIEDALNRICLPIDKVRALGFVIEISNDEKAARPFDGYFVEDVSAIGRMLVDAAEESKELYELAQEHEQKQRDEIKDLRSRIHDLEARVSGPATHND
jgi:hypothetical protein